ncbi:MAG TPA: hypothetical protein VIN08_27050 [Ohtaekwangia sp.]
MENNINLSILSNPYLRQFSIAQRNLNKLIEEERLQKRIRKSKRQARD